MYTELKITFIYFGTHFLQNEKINLNCVITSTNIILCIHYQHFVIISYTSIQFFGENPTFFRRYYISF